jgi:hypothetical protein
LALYVTPEGDVGLGTDLPDSAFHLVRDDETARLLVEEQNAIQDPRTFFEIKNKGNPAFRMTNSGNGNSWLFIAGTRFVLDYYRAVSLSAKY